MKKFILLAAFLPAFLVINAQVRVGRSKGAKTIGTYLGSVGFNPSSKYKYEYPSVPASNSEGSSNSFSIGISPTLGFFVSDNVLVGSNIDLYLSNSREETPERATASGTYSYNGNSNYYGVGVSPFARFFFGDAKNTLWPYAEVSGGISIGPSKSESNSKKKTANPATSYTYTSNSKSSGLMRYSGGVRFGAVKMFSPNLGLDFSAGVNYNHSKSKYKSNYKYLYDNGTTDSGSSEYNYTSTSFPVSIRAGVFIMFAKKK